MMKSRLLTALTYISILSLTPFACANEAPPVSVSSLAREDVFALGGVGVAGTMSSGEESLRELLKQADAGEQLQSLLKDASPAGQLYALLGLRLRDRRAYEQAVSAFRTRSDTVSTMHGCIMTKEKMNSIVRQIERGDYDAP
jgi:hypothetical protein